MELTKEILMTIVKNSSNYLEGEQEILKINEKQLHFISKELSKLFSLYGVSQRSELLTDFLKDFFKGTHDVSDEDIKLKVQKYISVNCG